MWQGMEAEAGNKNVSSTLELHSTASKQFFFWGERDHHRGCGKIARPQDKTQRPAWREGVQPSSISETKVSMGIFGVFFGILLFFVGV